MADKKLFIKYNGPTIPESLKKGQKYEVVFKRKCMYYVKVKDVVVSCQDVYCEEIKEG